MKDIRKTTPDKMISIVRLMLGIVFIMTGIMKLTLADYSTAWAIQLTEANIPFFKFNYWFVPVFEVLLGLILLIGYYSRIAALTVLPVMFVATYVHLTVDNPAAFPSQPQEPYAPIVIIILSIFILIKGAGEWSMDISKSVNRRH